MMNKWLDKLKKMLQDDQHNDHEPTFERDTIRPIQQGRIKHRTYLPNEIDGRVQNIYPKPGAYRFPIDMDPKAERAHLAPQNRRIRSPREKQVPTQGQAISQPNSIERNNPARERSYFQGQLKRSTITPSPVYGFSTNHNKHQPKLEEEIKENREENKSIHYTDEKITDYPNEYTNEYSREYLQEALQDSIENQLQEHISEHIDEHIDEHYEVQIDKPFEERIEELYEEQIEENLGEYAEEDLKPYTSSQGNIVQFIAKEKGSHKPFIDKPSIPYQFPEMAVLRHSRHDVEQEDDAWIDEQAEKLMETFHHFNLKAELIGVTQGPTVTRFEIQPAPGIKISKFTNLLDDLKLSLAAKEIRIEAPIPGKHAIGIEVPNSKPKPVHLGGILQSPEFLNSESPLTICLGADLSGEPIVTDIQKMPHGLIAGATGSGKSVCINSLLVSLLYKATPEQLRLLLIDPKVVELTPYQTIPHLVTPVVTDPKRATAALKWAVDEMERRYLLFAEEGVRDLKRYNSVLAERTGEEYTLPYIVIIIDELADLMMVSPQDVEDAICRITQKARACGIHLIVATQRPSVDVITGLIKANIPTRLAFSVSSQIDSRTILDMSGAERLLGKGDMLFLQNGASKPIRVQGNFVSDEEIEEIIAQVSSTDAQRFLFTQEELSNQLHDSEMEDDLIDEATFFVMEQGIASASSLQRKFRIGYNRAARLIDWMEEQGMISESSGSKPRQVLWSQEQYLEWFDQKQNKA